MLMKQIQNSCVLFKYRVQSKGKNTDTLRINVLAYTDMSEKKWKRIDTHMWYVKGNGFVHT